MPMKSKAQNRFMWAKHPEIAQRWEKEKKQSINSLPEKAKKKTTKAKKK